MSKQPAGPAPRGGWRLVVGGRPGSQSLLHIGKFKVESPGHFLKCTEPQGPPWRDLPEQSQEGPCGAGQGVLHPLPAVIR